MTAITLAEVETKITALINNPQVDYKEGDVTVKASQKLAQLLKVKKFLIDNPEADVETMNFNLDVNEFGEMQSEFED